MEQLTIMMALCALSGIMLMVSVFFFIRAMSLFIRTERIIATVSDLLLNHNHILYKKQGTPEN